MRLRRIRCSFDWYRSCPTRERVAFLEWVDAAFGVPAWRVVSVVVGGEVIFEARR